MEETPLAAAEPGSPPSEIGAPSREPGAGLLSRVLYSVNAWTAACLALGAAYAFNSRHAMNPDGLSYLEIGQMGLRVGPRGLVSTYWSPGYPALIAAAFGLARPNTAAEFPVAHALNFAILMATVFVFRRLLRSWTDDPRFATGSSTNARALVPIGFGIFVLIVLTSVGPGLVTPDLAVLGATLLIALAYQRLRTSGSWWAACAFGASCALGYWMKTAMLPLAAMLFALLLILPPPIPRARSKLIAAGAVTLLASAPLIAMISAKLGRPSYGESGRLNYAWLVLGEAPFDSSSLAHPPRVLLTAPKVIEFGTPIPGTFPPHYDDSYWSEGIPTHFDLRAQARSLASNTISLVIQWLTDYPGLLAMLIALAVARGARLGDRSQPGMDVLLLWGIGWIALYAAVLVQSRYTAPAVLMISLSIMRTFLPMVFGVAAKRVAIVAVGFVLLKSASVGVTTLKELRNLGQPSYLELADRVREIGLTPGTWIAVVGFHEGYESYYAHAAGLRIAAAVIDSTDPAPVTGAALDRVKAVLAQAGIRAIVRSHGPVDPSDTTWKSINLSDGTVAGVTFTTPAGGRAR